MSRAKKRTLVMTDVESVNIAKKHKKVAEKLNGIVENSLKVQPTSKGVEIITDPVGQNCEKNVISGSDFLNKSQDVNSLNISQLLDLGEGRIHESCDKSVSNCEDSQSDSEEDEWEEVEAVEKLKPKDPVIAKEGVDIVLPVPQSLKRKKKGFDIEAHIKKQVNQAKRELQLLMHKVHVLCWIAHLQFVNKVLNSETLMGTSLSLITNNNLYPPKYADISYLERILKWFHKTIHLNECDAKLVQSINGGLLEELGKEFNLKTACSKKHFIFMFIVFLRTLGLKTRIVMSFQVVPIRPKTFDLNIIRSEESLGVKCEVKHNEERYQNKSFQEKKIKADNGESSYFSKKNVHVFEDKLKLKGEKEALKPSDVSNLKKGMKKEINKSNVLEVKSNKVRTSNVQVAQNCMSTRKELCSSSSSIAPGRTESDDEESYFNMTPKRSPNFENFKNRKQKKGGGSQGKEARHGNNDPLKVEKKKRQIPLSESSATDSAKNGKGKLSLHRNIRKKEKTIGNKGSKISRQTGEVKGETVKSRTGGKTKLKSDEKALESSDADDDFIPQSLEKKTKTSRSKRTEKNVLSEDEAEKSKGKQGIDVWTEIFLESEEKWISVDVLRQKVHCINELYSRATQPVSYVVACNSDFTMKDVTKRYVPNWHSDTKKRRVDDSWWKETMCPFASSGTAHDREEDEDMERQLMDKPLPTAISQYKDHPLYALKRHLLKFEGIYPPDAPTLGFIRGEAVYARECVTTLHSREMWYKEARVVRLNEQPYKVVKARPKFDKMTGEIRKDLPLELYGIWQTEEYIPPIATNGKVPRNEYGNVDLFKPCMLPIGTVHLQVPGLNKTAKKMGIDCAPAVVGFEFHGGASHPVYDGFVVCEEFKDALLDSWNKELDENNKKNEEKRLKAIYDNWKRLIRGLLIREKLKTKYAFGDKSTEENSSRPSGVKKRFTGKR